MLFPVCTVPTAVKIMREYGDRIFAFDSKTHLE